MKYLKKAKAAYEAALKNEKSLAKEANSKKEKASHEKAREELFAAGDALNFAVKLSKAGITDADLDSIKEL